MARPRIFVSSTYYDLKHIRREMKKFIEQYGYEAILNETGSIPYHHYQPLDESCFQEAKQCNMFILVIGGRYGSAISSDSDQPNKEIQNDFYKKYTSITRNEYRTAYESKIPIYIFVEKEVYSEYRTYQKNKGNSSVNYAFVDSAEIFEFIAEALNRFSNNNVCSFERFDDIAHYLREQWAGLFHAYLQQLQNQKDDNRILNSISKLEQITDNIQDMVNTVGKTVMKDEDYQESLREQNRKLLTFYSEKLAQSVSFVETEISSEMKVSKTREDLEKVGKMLIEYFNTLLSLIGKQNFDRKKLTEKEIPSELKRKLFEIYNVLVNNLREINQVYYSVKFDSSGNYYEDNIVSLLEREPSLKDDFEGIFLNEFVKQKLSEEL